LLSIEQYKTESLKRKLQVKQIENKVCNRKMQWPTIPVWWQKKGYCSDMPNAVSAIDGTSHEIQIPSNESHQYQ
jgi:hypothetical protein